MKSPLAKAQLCVCGGGVGWGLRSQPLPVKRRISALSDSPSTHPFPHGLWASLHLLMAGFFHSPRHGDPLLPLLGLAGSGWEALLPFLLSIFSHCPP